MRKRAVFLQSPIGFDQAIENLIRDAHVLAIVFGGHPQAQNLCAEFFDDLLRRDHIAQGLGHLSSLAVERETVSEDAFIRRAPARCQRGEQRRVKPAAVLVAAFEIKIGSATQARIALDDRRPAHSRVEPDVENILPRG